MFYQVCIFYYQGICTLKHNIVAFHLEKDYSCSIFCAIWFNQNMGQLCRISKANKLNNNHKFGYIIGIWILTSYFDA